MANKQVAKTKESYIKINDGKKQTWIPINDKLKDSAKKALNYCGDEKKIEDFTKEYDMYNLYTTTMKNAEKMIFELSNSDKKEWPQIREKYQKDYINLLYLNNSYTHSLMHKEKMELMIEKINHYS
jgi:hypothetical protein